MPKDLPLDKRWHLADDSPEEFVVTDFEFLLWRTFYGFLQWQQDCQAYICEDDNLTGYEIALLHLVRIGDKPKTIYDIGRLLNRDDYNGIRYGIKKLIDLGYVKQVKTNKKANIFQITKKGVKSTDTYTLARKEILINLFREYPEIIDDLPQVTKTLTKLSAIYMEASRRTAAYQGMESPPEADKNS